MAGFLPAEPETISDNELLPSTMTTVVPASCVLLLPCKYVTGSNIVVPICIYIPTSADESQNFTKCFQVRCVPLCAVCPMPSLLKT